ncbi:MAG: Uncharacterized MFS-type transporter, partial [uncultured Gemmatimonadetes bacterium]
ARPRNRAPRARHGAAQGAARDQAQRRGELGALRPGEHHLLHGRDLALLLALGARPGGRGARGHHVRHHHGPLHGDHLHGVAAAGRHDGPRAEADALPDRQHRPLRGLHGDAGARRLLHDGGLLRRGQRGVPGGAAVLRRAPAGGQHRGEPRAHRRDRGGRGLHRLVLRGGNRAVAGDGEQAPPLHRHRRRLHPPGHPLLPVRTRARQPAPPPHRPGDGARLHLPDHPHAQGRGALPRAGALPGGPRLLHGRHQHRDLHHGAVHGQHRREHRARRGAGAEAGAAHPDVRHHLRGAGRLLLGVDDGPARTPAHAQLRAGAVDGDLRRRGRHRHLRAAALVPVHRGGVRGGGAGRRVGGRPALHAAPHPAGARGRVLRAVRDGGALFRHHGAHRVGGHHLPDHPGGPAHAARGPGDRGDRAAGDGGGELHHPAADLGQAPRVERRGPGRSL